MQLIGFVAGRINACEFGKDLVNLLILPTCALTGTGLAERLHQTAVPTADSGVEVLQNTSGRPVTADLVVALTTVNVPSSSTLGSNGAIEAERLQLVVSSLSAASRTELLYQQGS